MDNCAHLHGIEALLIVTLGIVMGIILGLAFTLWLNGLKKTTPYLSAEEVDRLREKVLKHDFMKDNSK
jgi:ABC-type lipoprotein release transport system permease subunit